MWLLITGAAKGLGAAMAIALAKKGYNPVIHYRNSQEEALKISRYCQSFGVKSQIIQGNFESEADLDQFLTEYQARFPVTCGLINNASIYLTTSALNTSYQDWYKIFQVNLHSAFKISQAIIPILSEQQGQILNIGVAGLKREIAHLYASAYRMSKRALFDLTISFAKELACKGVRVNMVSPGQMINSTDLALNFHQLPMQRPANFDEVCRIVTFLFDPASNYITGQNIEIAGGLSL
jgi:NAD(P)-dependent dehydrogenase (short-subunit alcohol dehydrogenase family)